jgi:hypothetical protein
VTVGLASWAAYNTNEHGGARNEDVVGTIRWSLQDERRLSRFNGARTAKTSWIVRSAVSALIRKSVICGTTGDQGLESCVRRERIVSTRTWPLSADEDDPHEYAVSGET